VVVPQCSRPAKSAQRYGEGGVARSRQDLLIGESGGGWKDLAHADCRTVVKLFKLLPHGLLEINLLSSCCV
jgi:hypothetical protein